MLRVCEVISGRYRITLYVYSALLNLLVHYVPSTTYAQNATRV